MYDLMRGDKQQKKKKINRLKFLNKWLVVPLYRINLLPLFGMGRIFLLAYHTGRKSGNPYITPLEYRRYETDSILVFASRGKSTDWFQNIKSNPEKTEIKLGFRKYKPDVRIVEDTEMKLEYMKWYVSNFGSAAKMLMGWDPKHDEVKDELISPIAEFIEIIEFQI